MSTARQHRPVYVSSFEARLEWEARTYLIFRASGGVDYAHMLEGLAIRCSVNQLKITRRRSGAAITSGILRARLDRGWRDETRRHIQLDVTWMKDGRERIRAVLKVTVDFAPPPPPELAPTDTK
jgi:hypothetical protein